MSQQHDRRRAGAARRLDRHLRAAAPTRARPRPSLRIPLVRRIREPGAGRWALPGGWLPVDESLDAAAARTLAETTGSRRDYLEQLYTFGDPDRSPDERVVSVVYWALVRSDEVAARGRRRERALVRRRRPARARLRPPRDRRLRALAAAHQAGVLAHRARPPRRDLHPRRAARGARGRAPPPLDPANFRRTIEASGTLVDTGQRLAGTPHRPPALYRFDTGAGPAASDRPATTALQRTNP